MFWALLREGGEELEPGTSIEVVPLYPELTS